MCIMKASELACRPQNITCLGYKLHMPLLRLYVSSDRRCRALLRSQLLCRADEQLATLGPSHVV